MIEKASSWTANAGRQPRLKAEARHERTLEAVACTPWFGPDVGLSRELCAGQREIYILVCGVITPWIVTVSNFARIQVRRT